MRRNQSAPGQVGVGPKKNTLAEIQKLEKDREERRKNMERYKSERAAEVVRNQKQGNPGDVDFQRMIRKYRESGPKEQPHAKTANEKITICVRKRPISDKEVKKNDHDSVTCSNPIVTVHESKLKVDGISKYLDNTSFEVDHSFAEDETTDDIYVNAVQPLIPFVIGGGRSTVFAYGQTGSGKTYTMQGIQKHLVQDLFENLDTSVTQVYISYFEIYGGRCQDLLNNRQRLQVREDGAGEVVVGDLQEVEVETYDQLYSIMEIGNGKRTTHATESNDESSRSHAICQITLRFKDKLKGKLTLIDLAGSERGTDTKSHNQQRRLEGAEINKSLLALKECIRSLDSNSSHVPYRGSKLTLVLKDSFTSKTSKTVMIATVSPAASSADHTLNTLRYADRIKERVVGGQARANAKNGVQMPESHDSRGAQGSSSDRDAAKAANVFNKIGAESKHGDDDQVSKLASQPSESKEASMHAEVEKDLHNTVEHIFEEEEALLNLHMNIIQENAELLTEEGRLLQQIQGDDNDIDSYATRLDAILARKQSLIENLRNKLRKFREALDTEEQLSKTLSGAMKF